MANKIWTEEEVLNLMEEKFGDLPLSEARVKAECWIIDHNGYLPNENPEAIKSAIKEATKGAKDTSKKREYKPREKDKEKLWLIDTIRKSLSIYDFETCDFKIKNVQIVNDVKEISFTVGENEYSLSLIKHRKPKN